MFLESHWMNVLNFKISKWILHCLCVRSKQDLTALSCMHLIIIRTNYEFLNFNLHGTYKMMLLFLWSLLVLLFLFEKIAVSHSQGVVFSSRGCSQVNVGHLLVPLDIWLFSYLLQLRFTLLVLNTYQNPCPETEALTQLPKISLFGCVFSLFHLKVKY